MTAQKHTQGKWMGPKPIKAVDPYLILTVTIGFWLRLECWPWEAL